MYEDSQNGLIVVVDLFLLKARNYPSPCLDGGSAVIQ